MYKTRCYLVTIIIHFYQFYPTNLSLYSTATQNTWRRGLALANAPDARILCWRYQHVGIFWRYLTLKFALAPTQNLKFALAPKPTPDDASQWNILGVGSSGVGHVYFMYISCIFHVVCASFSAFRLYIKCLLQIIYAITNTSAFCHVL